MRTAETTIIERMINTARAACRCREAAWSPEATPHDREALLRAGARYSSLIADLADEMLNEWGRA